jgi:hypothetical protein
MSRVCQGGCGTKLVKEDGSTDYKRRFCNNPDCRKKDKAARMREIRASIGKAGRCPYCGSSKKQRRSGDGDD